ncbi:RNA polymerase sigma factor [Nannocystaceae bacterium ST9]
MPLSLHTAGDVEGSKAPSPVRGWVRPVPNDSPARPSTAVDDHAADRLLMHGVAERDSAAQRRLVERVLPRVRKRAWSLTRSPEDADDATQAAMLEILRSAGNYDGRGSLDGWCERVAIRTIVRRQRGNQQRAARIDPSIEPDAIEDLPAGESMRERIRGEVDDYLGSLSDERRQAIRLRYVDDFSIDEIADFTGVSRNTVKDRLRCALEQLRKHIHRADVIALGRRTPP